jgi:hypothetical protein
LRRRALLAAVLALAGCQHGPQPPPLAAWEPDLAAASAPGDEVVCAARRSANRERARAAAACATDGDCIRAGQYETGACDAWVGTREARPLLRELRAAADQACGAISTVVVQPACRDVAPACVVGRCSAGPAVSGAAPVAGTMIAAAPKDGRCVGDALARITKEKPLLPGTVELRFPLASDGRPPRWFEAVAFHDEGAAVAVARALAACRWGPRDGRPLPADAWGSMRLTLQE